MKMQTMWSLWILIISISAIPHIHGQEDSYVPDVPFPGEGAYTQFNCVEDGFYVDPQQCDKYYHCSRGQYTEKLCPDGLIFDDTLGPRVEQCNYNFIVSCPEGKTQQQAQPSGINNECPRQNGLFEHEDPTNCKTYYDCVNGVPNTRECHADLHFDEFSGVCDWASKVFRSGCEDRPNYNRCMLQKDSGYGDDSVVKFYYNLDLLRCHPFIYNGKGGNANRFSTLEDCQIKCEDNTVTDSPDTETFGLFVKGRCNDNYDSWVKQPLPLGNVPAETFCKNNKQRLACPINDKTFYVWLQNTGNDAEYWFAGKQEPTTGAHYNYMTWASGIEISREIPANGGDTNMWSPTQPKYGEINPLCVKGKGTLSSEDCNTTLQYWCSPPA